MKIFPAIDIFDKKAVRLYHGDYSKMTVYSDNPIEIIKDFEIQGAKNVHLVDLEGAKTGETPNIELIKELKKNSNLFTELGGGIRSLPVIEKYVNIGIDRVILGTAAVVNPEFLRDAIKNFRDKIAVGVDIFNGKVAIKGWTENSNLDGIEFLKKIEDLGVSTAIVTDISKDGAMQGTNLELYKKLKAECGINVIASGGVSNILDVKNLTETGIYGAIIGKAYYVKAIDIKQALEVANDN